MVIDEMKEIIVAKRVSIIREKNLSKAKDQQLP